MTVWAEQAIYTSIPRSGRAGYHVVARSPGVPESEATGLATWAPSQGALIIDAANRTSVNFHPLPSGRLALSRSCAGPAEYSGRGERQLYTHALIFERESFTAASGQPIAIYRDALALGYLHYRAEPPAVLAPVEVGTVHQPVSRAESRERAQALGVMDIDQLQRQLAAGESVKLRHQGDRIAVAETLLGVLPHELIAELSFSTSLHPSAVRPCRLLLLN